MYGDTLAKIKVPDTLEIPIFQLLNGDSLQLREFLSAYIANAAVRNGLSSLWNKFLEVIKKEAIPPEKNVFFLLALPCTLELFLKIEAIENTAYEELYWKKIDQWIPAENSVLIFAMRKFSIYDRPISALNTMGKLNFDGELKTAYLQKTLQELNLNVIGEPVGIHLDSNGCREVFKKLHNRKNIDKELMAKVEFKYLFLFEDVSHGIYPQYLFQAIALNPELFVHFIRVFFVTDDMGEADASMKEMSDAQQVMIGKNAYYILRNFNCIPGMKKEGFIDAAKLENWIDQVRILATDCHRLKVADEKIGSLLGRYPNGNKPMFFPIEIYNLLERLNSRAMKNGFSMQLFNRMGMTSRSPDAGGDIERNRSSIFRKLKEEVEISHPCVAEIFRNLEKDFDRQALREDEEAMQNIVEY